MSRGTRTRRSPSRKEEPRTLTYAIHFHIPRLGPVTATAVRTMENGTEQRETLRVPASLTR